MILIKDKIKREITDKETIKMFLEAGWIEFKEVKPKKEKDKVVE